MVDEQQPPKKVVKRVVKKAVARPPAPADSGKTLRYGRAVTVAPSKPKAKAAAKTKTSPARPKIEVGAKVGSAGKAIASRGSSAASGAARATSSASRSIGSSAARGLKAVSAWRIPHWDPLPASIFTGAVVGLVSVGLGLAAKSIFNELRGVSSGGGRWGSLTFVVVTFVAFALGELLLTAFGSTQARLTSFLGAVLTIVAILGLFLGLADTGWALIIVPSVAALSYAIANGLLNLAESSPTLPE